MDEGKQDEGGDESGGDPRQQRWAADARRREDAGDLGQHRSHHRTPQRERGDRPDQDRDRRCTHPAR